MKRIFLSVSVFIALMSFSCQSNLSEFVEEENVVFSALKDGVRVMRDSVAVVTVKEFKEMVGSSCSQVEWDFISQLPDTLQISIYDGSRPGRFAKLNENNVEMMKSLLAREPIELFNEKQVNTKADSLLGLIQLQRIKNFSETGDGDDDDEENDWTEYRTIQWDIINMTSYLWPKIISSKLVATFNYVYNVTKHKVVSVNKPICDVVRVGLSIDGVIFVWDDEGSVASPMNDGTGIIYTINGTVRLGVSIDGYEVGFPCFSKRGLNGQFLVPYD